MGFIKNWYHHFIRNKKRNSGWIYQTYDVYDNCFYLFYYFRYCNTYIQNTNISGFKPVPGCSFFIKLLRYLYYSQTGNFTVIEGVCISVSRKNLYKRKKIIVAKLDDLNKPIDREIYFFQTSNSSIEKGMKLCLYVPSNINYISINGIKQLTTILALKAISIVPDDVLEDS